MSHEVEMKFPAADVADVLARLRHWDAVEHGGKSQVDLYFAHPARDFAQTDEALRLRQEGKRFFLTYKGPKLDRATKTREEIEVALADAPAFSAMQVALLRLGFRLIRQVAKVRTIYAVRVAGRDFEVAVDDVEGLGRFIEIETLADAATWETARTELRDFANQLGLSRSETRSYLELLLAQNP